MNSGSRARADHLEPNDPDPSRSSAAVRTAILAGLPALLLADTAIALVRGWRVGGILDSLIVTGAAASLVLLLVAWSFERGRTLLREHGGSLVYLVVSFSFAWLVSEAVVAGVVRYYPELRNSTPAPHVHRRLPLQDWSLPVEPGILPGVDGISRYTTNSLGIRGPELPPRDAAYRILTIGGSTTECTYLDDRETWQHHTMERLNRESGKQEVWIGSVGISGFPTLHHLRFIESSPLVEAVDCLVLLIGANDLNQFLRGKVLAGQPFLMIEELVPLWRRSPILTLARRRWHGRIGTATAEDRGAKNYQLRRAERQRAEKKDTLPENLGDALRDYTLRLQKMIELARSRGVDLVFVTQPTLWDEAIDEGARSMLWMGDMRGDYISVKAGRQGIDRYNRALLSVCEATGTECIDTASMNGVPQYYYDDFHYNEAGARALAHLVAQHLLDQKAPAGVCSP